MTRMLWVDATAGVAGDMLAAALIDAGVPLMVMREAVEAVLPGVAALSSSEVTRAGQRAVKFDVAAATEQEHRRLGDIRALISRADITPALRDDVERVFVRLAEAEAAAHGVEIEAVHFHEVGAVDSIADIVSVCAGLQWLGIDDLRFSVLELGRGTVRAAHGILPVPTPAAIRLTMGLQVSSERSGECATPTGLAILTTLGRQSGIPAMHTTGHGAGAGTRDTEDRANVVRVVLGEPVTSNVLIETNIDDMDPRLWPRVLDLLMGAGAQDAWLTPIVMKKGRPAHTLSVLCTPEQISQLEAVLFEHTTTIGVRRIDIEKSVLERLIEVIEVEGQQMRVKIAGRGMRILNVSIEFDDVANAARILQRSEREVLDQARSIAESRGYRIGEEFLRP